jgi:hypothetical protein
MKTTDHAACLLAAALVAGCGETKECQDLREISNKRSDVLASAKSQASVLDRMEKRAAEMETAAKRAKADLGLDKTEEEIQSMLEARTRQFPGATIERGTRAEAIDESNPGAGTESITQWIVHIKEGDTQKLFRGIDQIVALPPLTKLVAVIREAKGKPLWRVELSRATVDEVPIAPKPVKLPPAIDLSNVPTALGSCGAKKLRADIAKVDAEIESLRPRAERTTVLLPTAASWEGVRSRTYLLRDVELENREHIRALEGAAVDAKLGLKAIGVEGGIAMIEIYGGKSERSALEKGLLKRGLAESVQFPENPPPGVVRAGLPNKALEGRRVKRELGAPQGGR